MHQEGLGRAVGTGNTKQPAQRAYKYHKVWGDTHEGTRLLVPLKYPPMHVYKQRKLNYLKLDIQSTNRKTIFTTCG